MRDLNVDFMDLYKRVDRFLRDAYASPEGISEYLRQMEQNDSRGRWCVGSWEADYRQLKHMRWVRNQLSHEVGYDSDFCETSDYLWLDAFHSRLYTATDPLAVLFRTENVKRQQTGRQRQTDRQRQAAERQRLAEQQRLAMERQRLAEEQRRRQARINAQPSPTAAWPQPQSHPPKRLTLWQRIKRRFSRDKRA